MKFGNLTLYGSHQCVKFWFTHGGAEQLASSHHAALWSSTSLNTASHVAAPAEFRNAAVLSASPAALIAALVSLAMSMLDDHMEACIARSTLGAYVSRRCLSAAAKPATLSG